MKSLTLTPLSDSFLRSFRYGQAPLWRGPLAGTVAGPVAESGELTVEGFALDEWLKLRKASKPLAWRDDLSRLKHHFFPVFGARPLSWLATDDGGRALFSWAIPVHPFVCALLKAWKAEGWRAWMGGEPTPEDFIVPQSDGKQQRNWKLLAEFHADLDALGIPRQRQYENRSTFRNLLFERGAPEFAVNLMTHPSPKQASDFYTRLEMQWPTMCEAILRLEHTVGGLRSGLRQPCSLRVRRKFPSRHKWLVGADTQI